MWRDFYESSVQQMTPEVEQAWREAAPQCEGTGLFSYRVGWIRLANQDYDGALEVFNSGSSRENVYRVDHEMGIGDVYFQRGARSKSSADLDRAASIYEEVRLANPELYGPYEQLGAIARIRGDNQRAVDLLKKSIELGGSPYSVRTLTIAYGQLKLHNNVIESAAEALSRHAALSSDRDFMLTLAVSYASTGDFESSKRVMVALLSHDMQLKEDPEFDRILKAIAAASKRAAGGDSE